MSNDAADATGELSAQPTVVVVGAINVDLVVAAPRLPRPGETVVGGGLERHGGGKGANAAVAAARAGARVRLIGAVGADDDGARTLDQLQEEGVDVTGVAVLEREATGVALIVVAEDGENQIAVGAGANAAVEPGHVRHALDTVLATAGCVLVSTEIPGDAVRAAVRAATEAGVLCVLNPAPVIPEVLDLLGAGPILTPNASESTDLIRMLATSVAADAVAAPLDAAGAAARELAARTSAPVVVTLGGEGVLVLVPGQDVQHVPPRPALVRDTTGAGDTFNGVLATQLAAGGALADAVQVAAVAASLSVTRVGARDGMPSRDDITAAMQPA